MFQASIYVFALWTLILAGCQEAEKALLDPKLQKDSENVLEDLIELGEEFVEDETGVKVYVELPKEGKKDSAN